MNRVEIHERFGHPRSLILRRSSREVQYDYARFGLTLTVDEDRKLLHWHLAAPQSRRPHIQRQWIGLPSQKNLR